jgi:two-component system sensor histidine kinase KdpD
MVLFRLPQFARRFDPLAPHPRAATALGMALIALLVLVLSLANGATGPLGQSIPLFFLVPVLVSAAAGGRGPGVIVSCAAILAWNWFFIPPLYKVTIASVRDVLALIVFLIVAVVVGELSTVARRRTNEAIRRARSSEALYNLSMALIAQQDSTASLSPLTERLTMTFDLTACAILMPEDHGRWRTISAAGMLPDDLRVEHSRNVAAVAAEAYNLGSECRIGAVGQGAHRRDWIRRPRSGHERARFIPLRIGDRAVGVLELVPQSGEQLDVEREHLLRTFANGAAIALEQARLAREEQAAALAFESDKLKSALLSSVSHDLRTPLAGIKAAASSLLQRDVEWSAEDRDAFIADIDAEADRLTRLVSNLLDLSRIEAGAIRPDKVWEDVAELLDHVLARVKSRLLDHPIEIAIADDLPLARLDAVHIEQVVMNLLENAAKYSPPGSPIQLSATSKHPESGPSSILITVRDFGPGIPAEEQGKIFDKFYRVTGATSRVSGTGMGLAIVKGLVEAHGGHVSVESHRDWGSAFTVELPVDEPDGASRADLAPRSIGAAGLDSI